MVMKFKIERVTEDGYDIRLLDDEGNVLAFVLNVDAADIALVKEELRQLYLS
jgi:hypothetical protein